ncbi:MAG TPA: hypothetical protein VFT01_10465 [Homoserinimonas sp.]|nr:hypothetical protein [Homoserinimonas sp.]
MSRAIKAAAFASAVAVSLALAGCSVIDNGRDVVQTVANEVTRQVKLSELGAQLRLMDGIESVEGYYMSDADGIFAGVSLVAERVSDRQLNAAAEAIRRVFSLDLFADVELNATIDLGDGSRLEQQHFTDDAQWLADDLRYWRAAEEAIDSPLTMWILPPWPDADGYEYLREFNPVGTGSLQTTEKFVENYAALREVDEPTSPSATVWSILGLYSTPALPPEHAVALLGAAAAAAPLADIASWQVSDGELDGTYVWWDGELPDELTVEFLHPRESKVVPSTGVALAESLAATGITGYHLHLAETIDDDGSYVHFGTCAVTPDAYGTDSDAYSLLVGASAGLGEFGPGWCYQFPPA